MRRLGVAVRLGTIVAALLTVVLASGAAGSAGQPILMGQANNAGPGTTELGATGEGTVLRVDQNGPGGGARLVCQSCVTSPDLANGAVGTGQLANGAVGTGQLADGSVTQGKLSFSPATSEDLLAHVGRPGFTIVPFSSGFFTGTHSSM